MTTLANIQPPTSPPPVATCAPDNDDGLWRIKMELRKLTARQVAELQDYLASKGINCIWQRNK